MTAHLLQEDSHLATLTKGQSGQMMAACFVQAKYLVDTLNVIGLFVWERRKYVQQFDRSCGTFEPKLLEINAYLICKTFEWWYQNNNQCSIIPSGFLGTAWRLWATRPLAFPLRLPNANSSPTRSVSHFSWVVGLRRTFARGKISGCAKSLSVRKFGHVMCLPKLNSCRLEGKG